MQYARGLIVYFKINKIKNEEGERTVIEDQHIRYIANPYVILLIKSRLLSGSKSNKQTKRRSHYDTMSPLAYCMTKYHSKPIANRIKEL